VLDQLGLTSRLKGDGPQRRCACPLHRGGVAQQRSRTFSVNLERHVFHCHDTRCRKQGDVIDLWAAVRHVDLRAAALDLVQTFDLKATPRTIPVQTRTTSKCAKQEGLHGR
jgi:hypothetical protein